MIQNSWVSVKGYEGLYEINKEGQIRSLHKRNFQKAIQQRVDWAGYRTARLSKQGKISTVYVHRLLGVAFIVNPNSKPFINHKDCNKLNNSLDNLEWVTHSENMRHYNAHKRLSSNNALLHYKGKAIISLLDGQCFLTIKEAATVKGVNYNTLRNSLNQGANKEFRKVAQA